ncbi:hypothetical protein ABT024_05385 [Streptomyces sp. NPDC002812]|uniref:hypothetical protein n=1 Tax=Streptomyces sp. NPDC002812 TaxID=3154434 RepID=UPI003325EBAA
MPWDSVPWFIEGAAEHSSEVARLLAYAAFGGAEGVVGPRDLRVQALTSPAAAVRVTTGACAIQNKSPGGTYQSYTARMPTADQVSVAATGVSARSDLVIARIENPYGNGEIWNLPANPKIGPYVHTRIISGVSQSVTDVRQVRPGDTAITLARIDLPPNTSTVTTSMITDLREMVQPRRERRLHPVYVQSPGNLQLRGSLVNWPPVARIQVSVPRWATRAKLVTTLTGVVLLQNDVLLTLQLYIGDSWGNTEVYIDDDQDGERRTTAVVAGTVNIPASMRGTTQPVYLKTWINPNTSNYPGYIQVNRGTAIIHDIEFEEAPELDEGA